MYEDGDSNFRIQATVIGIKSYNIRHIKGDRAPYLNEEYTIVLDDGQHQAERYALYILDKYDLIDFLFPTMPPEPSDVTISANLQKFVSIDSFVSSSITVFYLQFAVF